MVTGAQVSSIWLHHKIHRFENYPCSGKEGLIAVLKMCKIKISECSIFIGLKTLQRTDTLLKRIPFTSVPYICYRSGSDYGSRWGVSVLDVSCTYSPFTKHIFVCGAPAAMGSRPARLSVWLMIKTNSVALEVMNRTESRKIAVMEQTQYILSWT